MNCSDVRELINAYIDGELGQFEAHQVERHIDKCESCREETEQFRKTSALIAEYGRETAPASLINDIRMKMEKEKSGMINLRSFRKTGWWALAASFILIVLGGAYMNVFKINGNSPAPAQQVMAAAPTVVKPETLSHAAVPEPEEMHAAEAGGTGALLSDTAAAEIAAEDTVGEEDSAGVTSPSPALPAKRMATAASAPVPSHTTADTAASEDKPAEGMTDREVVLTRVREEFDNMEHKLEMKRILNGGSDSEPADGHAAGFSAEPSGVIVPVSARTAEGRSAAGRIITVGAGGVSPRVVTGGFNIMEEVPSYESAAYGDTPSGVSAFARSAAAVDTSQYMRRVLRAEDVYSVENADAAAAECERIIEETLAAAGDNDTKYIRDGRSVILRGRFSTVDAIRRKLISNFTGNDDIGESTITGITSSSATSTQRIPPDLTAVLQINFTY